MLGLSRCVATISALVVLLGCGGGSSNNSLLSTSPPATTAEIPSNAKTFSNLHQDSGWTGYGMLPSSYAICQSCDPGGPEVTWSMTQFVSSPALSGSSTRFDIGGQTPYADVLWNNHLIGAFSTQGLPDSSKTLVPVLRNFIYDVSFYGTSLETSQILEFDINQFFDDRGYIWGHQCRIAGGHEWDTWDNVNAAWAPTGVPCNPVSNSWNHLTIRVQRTGSNQLLFQSITLNGVTNQLDVTRAPGSAPGWYGVVLNYQMDGNFAQQPYSVWLDKLNFTYW
jgi:hypothetical protein